MYNQNPVSLVEMHNGNLESIDEVTEIIAKNLSESEKQKKIEELKKQESELKEGLADSKSIIHMMVFETETSFFLRWASILKQLHYLGIYTKPISTIQEYIQIQVGKMDALSLDKKESIRTHLYKILPDEFREQKKSVNDSQKNTSGFLPIEESIVYFVTANCKAYCDIMSDILRKFLKHLEGPQIREDFEKIVEWEEIALMCTTLQQLVTPIKETYKNFEKLDHQLAEHHTLKNIEENFNMRQSVDTFRNAMRLLVQTTPSYRNWAHKFGISPRQHQRVRERDPDWPDKPVEQVIRDVLGSTMCPSCKIDLITKRKYYDAPPDRIFVQYLFREKRYKIPEQYKNKGLNPIQIAEKIWSKELRLVPVE